MRIGIIGQPCVDEIIAPDGTVRSRSIGGILYSYAAMERVMRETAGNDVFLPLTWYSIPDSELLDPFYAKLLHIESLGLWKTDALSNRVRLIYSTDADRIEHCSHILPAVTESQIAELDPPSLDGLFVNMISGYDLSLATLEATRRKAADLYIHLDIHALILGDLSKEIGHGRSTRGVKDWKKWVKNATTVQMNELEVGWLGAPEITTEETLIADIRSSCKCEGDWNTEAIIVTRAERGATLYDLRSSLEFSIPAASVRVHETTGSGDVFGSVFAFVYLKTKDLTQALKQAVKWAGWNTEIVGVEGLLGLEAK